MAKRDVERLSNEATAFKRLGADQNEGLGEKLDALIALVNELRDRQDETRTLVNELKADHNAMLAKLDADVGVADVNYAALHSTAAIDVAAVGTAKVKALA